MQIDYSYYEAVLWLIQHRYLTTWQSWVEYKRRYNPNRDPKTGRYTFGSFFATGGKRRRKQDDKAKERHAKMMYEEIRHRTYDAQRIAAHTEFTVEQAEDIRQHMFIRAHSFRDGTTHRFHPDFDQVQAWERIVQGRGTETDILLLRHEYMELNIMRNTGCDYETAHEKTCRVYDWWKAVLEERKDS